MPFLLKFNVVCEDQKEGGRGSVTPPPLKNPNLSNLHVKITLPPLLRKLDFSPLPLENGFLIRAWCSQTNFDNLRTSTDFFSPNNRLNIIFFSLHNSKKSKKSERYFTPTRTKLIDPDSENQGCDQGRWHFKRKMNESIRGL